MSTSTATPATLNRRTVTATVIGNFLELFDWFMFGLYVPLFAAQFFPSADPASSLLGAFAVFAAGMLFRPIGGLWLARLADRRGRKPALMLSILMMGGGSILIGVSPTYAQIGVLAPILLLVARAAQGMSSGGEYPAAVTYLIELAPAHRKCFYGSLFGMSAAAAALFAALIGGGLSAVLGSATMSTWGWRLPFIFGGVLAIALTALRAKLTESVVFQRQVKGDRTRGSLRKLLGTYWRSVLLVVAFAAGTQMLGATWTAVVPAVGLGLSSASQMFGVIVVVTVVAVAVQVPLGMLADRIGVKPFLAAYGLGFVVLGPLAYLTISGGFWQLLFSYGTGVMFMTVLTAVLPKVLTAAYPPEIRVLGIGLPHAVVTAVFGGVSPWLATYLASQGQSAWYIGIVVVTVLIATGAAWSVTRRFLTPVVPAPGQQPSAEEPPPPRLSEAA
jgi:MFS transporter, MHS family, alpha-ketoglutarate permease